MNAQLNINNNAAPNTGKKQNTTQRQNVIQTIKRLEKTSPQYKINDILIYRTVNINGRVQETIKFGLQYLEHVTIMPMIDVGMYRSRNSSKSHTMTVRMFLNRLEFQKEFVKDINLKLITRSVRKFQSKNAEQ